MRDLRKYFSLKFKLDRFEVSVISMGMTSFIIIGSVFIFYYFHFPILTEDNENWAHFGDFVGGTLSSIFSFLTFLAILYTLHLQREELRLNRKELETANYESKKQTQIASKQLESSIRQKNEEYLLEYMQVYSLLESEIKHSQFSGRIGAEFLRHFLDSENTITVLSNHLRRKDHYEIPTKPILKYLNCLEYLIYWDLLQSKIEIDLTVGVRKHTTFSSSYSPFIKSFCNDETFVHLDKSGILLKMNIAAQFPNISRFTSVTKIK